MRSLFNRTLLLMIGLSGSLTCFWGLPVFGQPARPEASSQTAATIRAGYHDRLQLLSHEFVYVVTVDMYGKNISVPLVKDGEGHFTAWVPDSNINTLYATAYRVDAAGRYLTSRYAIEPWNNPADQELLTTLFSKELGLPRSAIRVTGMSKKIRFFSAGGRTEGTVLAVPDTTSGIEVSSNASLYVYGYHPRGLADTLIQPSVGAVGTLTADEPWPEGAPVFDEQGNLLGISTGASRKSGDAATYFVLPLVFKSSK